ncbi:MAG: RecX family transcriptional regulator [Muribaculaceae bacterium]|nr:RecX family transcriptional regulator [Muribaculaceae bacterium]
MKRKPTAEEMLVRMAGLCAGAEQCAVDIRQKILRQGFSVEEAEKMLAYLRTNKYIDDSRYARAYAVDKVRFSGWGKLKVMMGLRAKGMSDSMISQALDYIPEKDYIEVLNKVLLAKARCLDLGEVKERQKLYRHLASRGFESQQIISAIRNYINNAEFLSN